MAFVGTLHAVVSSVFKPKQHLTMSDLCREGNDGESNDHQYSDSDEDVVQVEEGGDGSHHVRQAHGDHYLWTQLVKHRRPLLAFIITYNHICVRQ